MGGSLPGDMAAEILSRLPVKTVCKLRCVSKQWRNLISDDAFFKGLHRRRSMANVPLLVFRKYSSFYRNDIRRDVRVDLSSKDMEGGMVVGEFRITFGYPVPHLVSCGHLIVLHSDIYVFVCNPGTQELVSLPPSIASPFFWPMAFGWLPKSNQYKVVHMIPLFQERKMACEVFTLTDGGRVGSDSACGCWCWRRINDCPYTTFTPRSVCVSGVIYWMGANPVPQTHDNVVVTFDLETEEFGAISYPKWPSQPILSLLSLTGLKGRLCIVEMKEWAMNLWVLRDARDSIWVKEHTVALSHSNLHGNFRTRVVVPWDDRSGEVLVTSDQSGVFCCNAETKTIRHIPNSGNTHEEETYNKPLDSQYAVAEYKKPCPCYGSFFSLAN